MVTRIRRRQTIFFSVLAFVGFTALWASSAVAGDLAKLDTSLKLIPADAAFYSSMMRNREQFEAIQKSNTWAKIWDMPVVQMGVALYNMQLASPESGPAKLQEAMKNPEVRKILDLLAEMVSDEIFLYGDEHFVDFVDLLQKVNIAQSYAPILAQITGQEETVQGGRAQGKAVLAVLAENVEKLALPGLVVGFRLKNTDLAKEELIKLETIANILLEANETTKGRFKKTKVGDHDYLVLELDGGLIPWDELPLDKLKEMETQEGDAEKVLEHLKESRLVLALGVRGNFLVVSIGSSLDGLENLGNGDRLIDSDEMKPLEKHVDKRLISIGYLSEAMNQQLNNPGKKLENLLETVGKALQASKLSDAQKNKLREDSQALAKDVQTYLPEAGAVAAVSFWTDRGIEGYQYAWGDHHQLDGTKPLGLLEHIGGNPLLAVVARQKVRAADYDLFAKWVKIAYGYFEEYGLPAIPEKEREKVEKLLGLALPLFARFDTANRTMLLPALADGQLGFVLDGKLTSKQFLASLPATEKTMPMVEPALVHGVSDAKLLKEAFAEYRAVVNGLIDAARQIEGSKVPPDLQLPAPQVTEDSLGTFYSFALPESWGVDKKIAPTLAVSEKVAVVAASQDHAKRLLKATRPHVNGVLVQLDRPLAVAAWFDWAALVDSATPWVDFGIEQAAASQDEEQRKGIVGQVHTALDVLKAIRAFSSESYLEDDVLVHHVLLEIRDVGK